MLKNWEFVKRCAKEAAHADNPDVVRYKDYITAAPPPFSYSQNIVLFVLVIKTKLGQSFSI